MDTTLIKGYEKPKSVPVLIVVVVIFFASVFLNIFPSTKQILFSFVSPFVLSSSDLHGFVVGAYSNLITLDSTYQEVLRLRSEVLSLQGELDSVQQLEERIDLLEKQLAVKHKFEDRDIVLAQVVLPADRTIYNRIFVNVGSMQGVSEGDVVVVGDVFIGLISNVGPTLSEVILPTSRQSVLRVSIQPSEKKAKSGDATAIGDNDAILLDNVVMQAKLQQGQAVFVNDSKVGYILLMGKVGEVDENPSAPSQKGVIEPAVSYRQLKYVSVLVKKGE